MCAKTTCSTRNCRCGCRFPALAEIQLALEGAVADVTGCRAHELKRIMRTGTVASTDNRNWELLPDNTPAAPLQPIRAVALDMESATIAANGFRFRVPYGTCCA
jgi:AMP nucleosidase